MPSRITYNSIDIDLVREWNRFSVRNAVNNVSVQSMAGVQQTANFFDQDFITAERERLTAQEVIELEQFYEFAKDGSTFSFERDRNLGTYISFEGKSLKTNDGTAGTFAITEVTDSAYYLDPSTGNLTTVGITATDSNTPRFPAGQYGSGVLIEGARTNLVTDPSVINGNWTRSGVTLTTTNTTETVDPAGENNAELLTAAGGADFFEFDTSTAISTDDGVASIYLKSASGNVNVVLSIRSTTAGSLGTSGAIDITPAGSDGNGWTRITARHESSGSVADNWRLRLTFSGADAIYAYGGQIEVGTDVLFASQLIGAVSTSSITRSTENLEYSTTDVVNQDKGTISVWVKPEWVFDEHPAVALFWINSTVADDRVLSYFILANGNHEVRYYRGDNTRVEIAGSATSDFTQNVWTHILITYDSTISNGLLRYIDGVLDATSSNDPFSPADVQSLFAVGSAVGGASPAFAVFDDFMIRKDVFNAAQVRSLFNFGRGLGIRKNRWSSVKLKNPDFNPVQGVGNKYSFRLEIEEVLT